MKWLSKFEIDDIPYQPNREFLPMNGSPGLQRSFLALGLLLALTNAGCYSLMGTFFDDTAQRNKIFVGTRTIVFATFHAAYFRIIYLDLPLSFAMDTVLLPYTIPITAWNYSHPPDTACYAIHQVRVMGKGVLISQSYNKQKRAIDLDAATLKKISIVEHLGEPRCRGHQSIWDEDWNRMAEAKITDSGSGIVRSFYRTVMPQFGLAEKGGGNEVTYYPPDVGSPVVYSFPIFISITSSSDVKRDVYGPIILWLDDSRKVTSLRNLVVAAGGKLNTDALSPADYGPHLSSFGFEDPIGTRFLAIYMVE